MAALANSGSLKSGVHSAKSRFEVIIVETRSLANDVVEVQGLLSCQSSQAQVVDY